MKKCYLLLPNVYRLLRQEDLPDVVGSLPKYFNKDEFDVRVMIPKYTAIRRI